MTGGERVVSTETILRGVFSKNHFASTKGRVKYNAFLERKGVRFLSVDRADNAQRDELARLGQQRATERSRTFYGWGKLSVADAESADVGVVVRASPKADNPHHADIVLPRAAGRSRQQVAVRLARTSKWRPWPPPDLRVAV